MKQGSILAFVKPLASQPSNRQDDAQKTKDGVVVIPDEVQTLANAHDQTESEQIQPVIVRSDHSQPVSVTLGDTRAAVEDLRLAYVENVKSITRTLFPLRYSDSFFTECLDKTKSDALCAVATFDGKPVGWLRCRVEAFPNNDNEAYKQIYIQVIGILAPYRNFGLASALLDHVICASRMYHTRVQSVYAHVWENNEDAVSWYVKRGFKRIILQPQYYKRLKPSGAWIVRKELD